MIPTPMHYLLFFWASVRLVLILTVPDSAVVIVDGTFLVAVVVLNTSRWGR